MKCIVMCLTVLLLLVTGCESRETIKANREKMRLENLKSDATMVVARIKYIKDPRTGLCFAYYWDGSLNGGKALATVPCEAIPSHLLTVAK